MAAVMRRLGLALIVGLIALGTASTPVPAAAQASASSSSLVRWQDFIAEASHRFDIPAAWMRAESDGDPRTLSPKGAMGLMQIMPGTWADLDQRDHVGADPFDPLANILAGTAYLRELYERYGYPNLFAAYNAGPARLDEHLFHGRALPDETVAYLATLGQPTSAPSRVPVEASGTSLFFPLHMLTEAASNLSSVP